MDERKKYYAHSANAKGKWQLLKDHLLNTAIPARIPPMFLKNVLLTAIITV